MPWTTSSHPTWKADGDSSLCSLQVSLFQDPTDPPACDAAALFPGTSPAMDATDKARGPHGSFATLVRHLFQAG